MIPNICIRITRISLNIAVDKHIECGMKLTDGYRLAVRLSPCSVRPDTTGDLMKGTTDFYLPPVRPDVGHFKVQKIVWPMKTATVCHHSDSYCLYILKWKSSYFLKKTFLWLHLGLHHGSIIRIIQVGSYSISSSSAWKSQKKDLKHLGVLTISARNSGCIPYAHTLFVVACYSHGYSHHSLSSTE